ncbi:MAG: hypothetical protein P8P83_01120 [Rickettsiaceae bacterium]|nr:hypothetical protein [Rickettsiaceae bacterium]
MKRFYLLFIALFFPVSNALAANKSVIEYFAENFLIAYIISGGYYSLAAIVIIAIICGLHEQTRHVVLSVGLAVFGFLLVLFAFESFNGLKIIT